MSRAVVTGGGRSMRPKTDPTGLALLPPAVTGVPVLSTRQRVIYGILHTFEVSGAVLARTLARTSYAGALQRADNRVGCSPHLHGEQKKLL